MIDIESLRGAFRSIYATEPRIFSAPGRVNLIGEHTDYNDGYVLPMAIERRTVVAGQARSDRKVRVRSKSYAQGEEFDLDRPGPKLRDSWLDYVEGTAQALEHRGVRLTGADLLIDTDVPGGAGLSSSAALEMSIALALSSLAGQPQMSRVEMALAGQSAEHTYVGTMCGIMDQFIASLGQKDHALLIDCRTLQPTAVPLSLPGSLILICDTKVKHELASSEYNKRRNECEAGVAILARALANSEPGRQRSVPVRALRDVSTAEFEAHQGQLPAPLLQRCRHVITENARTLAAAEALGRGQLAEFGKLMVASHRSLSKDYEVSCTELDVAVDVAMSVPGVFGARMTGGGFGGCTVNLVSEAAVKPLSLALEQEFARRFQKKPEIFASRASEGAMEHTVAL